MQQVSDLWHEYWDEVNREFEYKITINNVEYIKKDIMQMNLYRSAMPEGKFGIGYVLSSVFEFSIRDTGVEIPPMAEVIPYMRINGEKGSTEWVQKGVYYINNQAKSHYTYDFECSDKIFALEKPFLEGAPSSFTMPMDEAVTMICNRTDIEIDPGTHIRNDYNIYNPTGLTMREILGFIASAHGGNFILNDYGKLRLVQLIKSEDVFDIEFSMNNFYEINIPIKIKSVKIYYTEDDCYTAGTYEEFGELSIFNEWATQEMADDLYNILYGYEYIPITATNAYINPVYELGDTVIAGGKESVIFNTKLYMGGLTPSDIMPVAESLTEYEYPYKGSAEKELLRETARLRNMISGIIVSCVHTSSVGYIVTIKITDPYITEIREESTYQFTVAYDIPNHAIIRIVDYDGNELASREWRYQNGMAVKKRDFIIGARVQVMDSGGGFFSLALLYEEDGKANFQKAFGHKKLIKYAIIGNAIGVRGDI